MALGAFAVSIASWAGIVVPETVKASFSSLVGIVLVIVLGNEVQKDKQDSQAKSLDELNDRRRNWWV